MVVTKLALVEEGEMASMRLLRRIRFILVAEMRSGGGASKEPEGRGGTHSVWKVRGTVRQSTANGPPITVVAANRILPFSLALKIGSPHIHPAMARRKTETRERSKDNKKVKPGKMIC